MFTLDTLAAELGIDPATLQAKPEVAAKWNGYLTEADTKYTAASQAQQAAEKALSDVKEENRLINENIKNFGMTEANTAALKANIAAIEAAKKSFAEQGFDIKLPDLPKIGESTPAVFDPAKFQSDVNASLILGFDMNNRYQRLYGSAMPDDLSVLLREATERRVPVNVWAEQKYDFKGREKTLSDDRQKKHDEEIASKAVKDYQEKNPITAGHPGLERGQYSRHPQLAKPRESANQRKFANMSAKNKIAQSVARTSAALAANAS